MNCARRSRSCARPSTSCWTTPTARPSDLRDMAADIRAAVDHAEHLIGALLILARNERGLTVHDEVDLASRRRRRPRHRRPWATGAVHATLEPAVMSGDPVLVERLVANLVDNADPLQHRRRRHLDQHPHRRGESHLTVANTGPLISPADADRIFQPFQRLNDRTSHDGFGLGLTIVASIAAVHGGTATAHPRDDGGLSITVALPSCGANG